MTRRRAGVRAAGTPAEAAQEADIVMTCLRHPEPTREVCFGTRDALEQITSGRIFIDFATVEPKPSREIGTAVAAGTSSTCRSAAGRPARQRAH